MAWTGVVRAKPMLLVKSRIHCESSGVSASNDFGRFLSEVSCAILGMSAGCCTNKSRDAEARSNALHRKLRAGPGATLDVLSCTLPTAR